MTSAFFFVFLVVFGTTPATENHSGFSQLTILESHGNIEDCKKSIKRLNLTKEQEESVGCVRVLKGNAIMVEA